MAETANKSLKWFVVGFTWCKKIITEVRELQRATGYTAVEQATITFNGARFREQISLSVPRIPFEDIHDSVSPQIQVASFREIVLFSPRAIVVISRENLSACVVNGRHFDIEIRKEKESTSRPGCFDCFEFQSSKTWILVLLFQLNRNSLYALYSRDDILGSS